MHIAERNTKSDSAKTPVGPSRSALLGAFAVVIVLFVASTSYTEISASNIEDEALSLTTNAIPSVETLSGSRRAVRLFGEALLKALAQEDVGGATAIADVRRTQAAADRAVAAYLALPVYPGEAVFRGRIERGTAVLDGIADLVAASAPVDQAADASSIERAHATLNDLDLAIAEDIGINGRAARALAASIHSTRRRTVHIAFGLDALCLLIALAAALVTLRYLRRAESRMIASDRMASLGIVAAGIAHEINNPLGYIQLNLEQIAKQLARGDRADDVARASLRMAQEGAERIRLIVRDVKTFANPGEVEQHVVDLPTVLETTLNIVANEVGRRAQLAREYSFVPPVRANPTQLLQVFLNLVLNAMQAIPDGEPERHRIRVIARTNAAGNAVVEVRDTGEGVAPEALDRLFVPFFTTKNPDEGTGLGLSICRSLIASLGGEIEVESERGRGSVFRVILPRAHDRTAASASSASSTNGGRARILLLEDEPVIATAICRSLVPEHDVVAITRVADALERLRSGERFDAVVSEYALGEDDGRAFFAELTRLQPDLAAKTVFLTEGTLPAAGAAFLSALPNARLEKPLQIEALHVALHELLGATATAPRTALATSR